MNLKAALSISCLLIYGGNPLWAETGTQDRAKLESCIEEAENVLFVAKTISGTLEQLSGQQNPRHAAKLITALRKQNYDLGKALVPLLEEKADHDTILQAIFAYFEKLEKEEGAIAEMLQEAVAEEPSGRAYTKKATYIVGCVEGFQ
jgi:hypothetical protein